MADKVVKNTPCPSGSRKKYNSCCVHNSQHDNAHKIMSITKFWYDGEFDYKILVYVIAFFFISLVMVILTNRTLVWLEDVDGLVVEKHIREFAYISNPGSDGAYGTSRPATYGTVEKYNLTLRTAKGDSIRVTVSEEIFNNCELQKNRVRKPKFSLNYLIVEQK